MKDLLRITTSTIPPCHLAGASRTTGGGGRFSEASKVDEAWEKWWIPGLIPFGVKEDA